MRRQTKKEPTYAINGVYREDPRIDEEFKNAWQKGLDAFLKDFKEKEGVNGESHRTCAPECVE